MIIGSETLSFRHIVPSLDLTEVEPIFNLFDEVCVEKGWPVDGTLKSYMHSSVFWSGYRDDNIVCAVQLVRQNGSGFPIFKPSAWPELEKTMQSDRRYSEVAMIAVEKEARGSSYLFVPLYFQMYRYCCQFGVTHLFAILDSKNLRLYRRFGVMFEIIGEEKMYWNEICIPTMLSIEHLGESFKALRYGLLV